MRSSRPGRRVRAARPGDLAGADVRGEELRPPADHRARDGGAPGAPEQDDLVPAETLARRRCQAGRASPHHELQDHVAHRCRVSPTGLSAGGCAWRLAGRRGRGLGRAGGRRRPRRGACPARRCREGRPCLRVRRRRSGRSPPPGTGVSRRTAGWCAGHEGACRTLADERADVVLLELECHELLAAPGLVLSLRLRAAGGERERHDEATDPRNVPHHSCMPQSGQMMALRRAWTGLDPFSAVLALSVHPEHGRQSPSHDGPGSFQHRQRGDHHRPARGDRGRRAHRTAPSPAARERGAPRHQPSAATSLSIGVTSEGFCASNTIPADGHSRLTIAIVGPCLLMASTR